MYKPERFGRTILLVWMTIGSAVLLISPLEGMDRNLFMNIKLGRFRTNQTAEDLPEYTIGPEIEIETKLIRLRGDTLFTSASLYSFVWDDFVNKPTELSRPRATWSTTCIGTGIRLKMNMQWIWRFSLRGFYGISHFYSYKDYIGGGSEFPTADYEERIWLHELGVNLGFQITKNMHLIAEYSYLDRLQSGGFGDKIQIKKIGIVYGLK